MIAFKNSRLVRSIFAASVLGCSTWAFADAGSSSLKLPERVRVTSKPERVNGSFSFHGDSFLSDRRTKEQSESYGYVTGSLSAKDRRGDFDWAASAQLESSVQPQNEFYFGAPEFFARLTNDDNDIQVSIGRQKRDWSRLDSQLNLGLWQPQLRWDYLNPVQQGLTGVFFDARIETLTVSLFASPVFLPDQGPQFRMHEGRFVSANRWFWQPQSRLSFSGTPSNLYYDLVRPSEEDVVMNSSLGGQILFDPSGPAYSRISYAYKPMNQFFIGFECTSCIDAPTLDARARIHPKVVNHHVLTWETGWEDETDHAYFSLTSDRPRRPNVPSDWGGTTLSSLLILGGSYSKDFAVSRFPVNLGISYMRSLEMDENAMVNDLTGHVESSGDRFLFEDLFTFTGTVKLYSSLRSSADFSLRYSYSVFERGSWLSSRWTYHRDRFEGHLGFDILGSETDPLSSRAGLFSRYRSNDRISGGVGFVF